MSKQASSKRREDISAVHIPPHSVEAEQSVLGGLMLDNLAWDKVIDRITETDFYQHGHRLIFKVITELSNRNHPFDVLTLSEALKAHHYLEDAGGEIYLFELAKNTPTAANIAAYADIVRERSILRQLISVTHEIADSAFHPEGRESIDILDEAERRVFEIAEQKVRNKETKHIQPWLKTAYDRVCALSQTDESITGLPTGYQDFDEMTSGLQAGDLIIIAGRPAMGKTALAMNIAEYSAIKRKKPVLVFSMEMSGESLALRMMSSWGRIDQHKVRTGKLDDQDWPRLSSAISALSEAPLFIDDTPALSPSELRARARRVYREKNELGLIIIDYLQLMHVPGTRENRTTEISEISRNLKALAKELNVPVIAISQLNRSLEQRTDKRPIMSDLRESGAIEQDADLITFIYRDEIYNEDTPHKGIAEIIIGKQRNGPVGKIRLTFLGKCTRFENCTYNNYSDERLPF
jgi:replicative DNA helicase